MDRMGRMKSLNIRVAGSHCDAPLKGRFSTAVAVILSILSILSNAVPGLALSRPENQTARQDGRIGRIVRMNTSRVTICAASMSNSAPRDVPKAVRCCRYPPNPPNPPNPPILFLAVSVTATARQDGRIGRVNPSHGKSVRLGSGDCDQVLGRSRSPNAVAVILTILPILSSCLAVSMRP